MSLSPADVHNVVFTKPPLGKRGYDADEVDAFLDVVEAELVRLVEVNSELQSSGTDAVPDERPAPGAGPAASPPSVAPTREDDSVRASRMLALATETADRYVGEAKQQAERIVAGAKNTSERILSEARTKSEQTGSEAKLLANSMLRDARSRADTMEREAQAKATALGQDAERRHVEAIGILEERRSSLERKLEELRTSESEFRARLRSYLESHLRDLDSGGSAEPASDTRQSQPQSA